MKSPSGRKCIILATVIICINVVYYYKTDILSSTFSCHEKQLKILRKIVNPPQLTETEEQILTYQSSKDKEFLAERLSHIVQSQLKVIQTPGSCDVPNFLCGHFDPCGFGCQVHHRVACLMISYALSMPLIHNEEEGWPYSKKWSDVFEPLGTRCLPGNNTFRWHWKHTSALYRGTPCFLSYVSSDQIEYPMLKGLPVSKTLGDLVEKIHPNPFLWWVGQFMKFALKPRQYFKDKIDFHKKAIGFSHPIVGLHVRRTDKIKENSDSHHEIEEYLSVAKDWLGRRSHGQDGFVEFVDEPVQRKLFIASDDSKVLPDAKARYPELNITGFLANRTLWSGHDRVDGFEDIVRDVLILSECDYVVCGLTSNICRLLLEILSSKHLDSPDRLASLDGEYAYIIQGYSLQRPTIIKVEPSSIFDGRHTF